MKPGKDISVFLVKMSWNGSIQLSSVTVMALLSIAPAHKIHFSPLASIVMLLVATKSETV